MVVNRGDGGSSLFLIFLQYTVCQIGHTLRLVSVTQFLCVTEYSIVEVRKDHLKLLAQDHVQMTFQSFQEGTLHNLSGQPLQYSVTLSVKNCFLMFRWNVLCSSLYPLPLVCHWSQVRRVWLCPLCTLPSGICAYR